MMGSNTPSKSYKSIPFLRILLRFIFLTTLTITFVQHALAAIGSNENRYSFSLTTFSPTGKLQQVEYASLAASLGSPVVAVILDDDTVLLAAPHVVPSPLVRDDGTRRFCKICDGITVAHSGIGADGRAVIAAAQRLAIEHAYTFDQEIPVEIFLEEVSLLFQKYTMRPGARPFGCSLLVASLVDEKPVLYKIVPSGNVEKMNQTAVLGSGLDEENVNQMLESKKFWSKDKAEATAILKKILTEKAASNGALKKKEYSPLKNEDMKPVVVGTFLRLLGLQNEIIYEKTV